MTRVGLEVAHIHPMQIRVGSIPTSGTMSEIDRYVQKIKKSLDDIIFLSKTEDYVGASVILNKIKDRGKKDKKYLLAMLNLQINEKPYLLISTIEEILSGKDILKSRSELISYFRKIKLNKISE